MVVAALLLAACQDGYSVRVENRCSDAIEVAVFEDGERESIGPGTVSERTYGFALEEPVVLFVASSLGGELERVVLARSDETAEEVLVAVVGDQCGG